VDILKELSVENDIVDLLQVRRLTYVGHVYGQRQIPSVTTAWLHTHGHRSRGRPKEMVRQHSWELA